MIFHYKYSWWLLTRPDGSTGQLLIVPAVTQETADMYAARSQPGCGIAPILPHEGPPVDQKAASS